MNILSILKEINTNKNINNYIFDEVVRKLTERGIKSINLSLSNLCSANCIYCPKTRGKSIDIHNMTIDTVKKIMNEITSNEFKKIHNVKIISVGENGDAFLNPNFIEILRYIKQASPKITISFNTNFRNFTKEKSNIIVKERLIDEITVNIDGHDEESYFQVKGISYKIVEQNILDFLEIRKENDSIIKLQIISLTLVNYFNKIFNKFGEYPMVIKENIDPKRIDDFILISNIWKPRLNPKIDILEQSCGVHGWAERNTIKKLNHDSSKYSCPNVNRIKNECFIAPNGDWYGCCFDETQKLKLGNVLEESINDIYFGENRKIFMNLLKNRNYEKIGYPCIFVEGCQSI